MNASSKTALALLGGGIAGAGIVKLVEAAASSVPSDVASVASKVTIFDSEVQARIGGAKLLDIYSMTGAVGGKAYLYGIYNRSHDLTMVFSVMHFLPDLYHIEFGSQDGRTIPAFYGSVAIAGIPGSITYAVQA